MLLQTRVAERTDRLTETDRVLLHVLLSNPAEASFLSAAEVADRAGVHQASATKLAQRLGYSGYPDLRRSLQHDLLDAASSAERVRTRVDRAGTGSLLQALVEDEAAALLDLPGQVGQDLLDAGADHLLRAGHRYLFAQGNSVVLATMLAQRLRRFGLPSTVLPSSTRGLAENLVGLREQDVVVVFALRRTPRLYTPLVEHVRRVAAGLVLVTDTLGPELGGEADVVLTGARGSGRTFQSLTVPMAVTNALVLTVARRAPDACGDALALLDRLLAAADR